MILDNKKVDPKIKCDNAGPLYFSLIYKKIDVFKFLLEINKFPVSQMYKNMNMFESSILNNQFEESDLLIQKTKIDFIGNYSYSCMKTIQNNLKIIIDDKYSLKKAWKMNYKVEARDPKDDIYLSNLICYFFKDSGKEDIEKVKKELINENLLFFTCAAARYSNEQDFEKFLDNKEIDFNDVVPESIFKSNNFFK